MKKFCKSYLFVSESLFFLFSNEMKFAAMCLERQHFEQTCLGEEEI